MIVEYGTKRYWNAYVFKNILISFPLNLEKRLRRIWFQKKLASEKKVIYNEVSFTSDLGTDIIIQPGLGNSLASRFIRRFISRIIYN